LNIKARGKRHRRNQRFWGDVRSLVRSMVWEYKRLRREQRLGRDRVLLDARVLGLRVVEPLTLEELRTLERSYREAL
jgi:hypothetical protein